METLNHYIEYMVVGIEILAVAIIVGASVFGTLRFVVRLLLKNPDAYEQYKDLLGKTLLLALQLLVAADIILTVVLKETLQSVLILALLVFVRTFLSWSLMVEMERCLPWSNNRNPDRDSAH